MDAFQHDSLVMAALAGQPWPETPSEKETVLRKAGRPVERILALCWSLYELDRDDLLDQLKWRGTLRETIDAYHAGNLPQIHLDKLKRLIEGLPTTFREEKFELICYQENEGILIEEGHHHAVAVPIANKVPPVSKAFLGKRRNPQGGHLSSTDQLTG